MSHKKSLLAYIICRLDGSYFLGSMRKEPALSHELFSFLYISPTAFTPAALYGGAGEHPATFSCISQICQGSRKSGASIRDIPFAGFVGRLICINLPILAPKSMDVLSYASLLKTIPKKKNFRPKKSGSFGFPVNLLSSKGRHIAVRP